MGSAAKKVAYSAIIAAMLTAVKYALSFLPNVELVSPLILVFASVFGFFPTFFGSVVFCIADIMLYGFFPTVALQYFFHFPLLSAVGSIALYGENASEFKAAVIAFVFAVLFWLETPIINAALDFSPFLPTLLSGIPFMLPMLITGVTVSLTLYKPLVSSLKKRAS